MPKKPTTGRASIFRGKDLSKHIRGFVTPRGRKAFEGHRRALAHAAAREADDVTDGDLIEALAIGMDRAIEEVRKSAALSK